MSMMVSFVLSFFPRDVLDEILNLIESVSEDFPSYSWPEHRSLYLSQNTVKKPEKPKFEVFHLKARRNETPQIAFHCVNEGFRMSAYGARFK